MRREFIENSSARCLKYRKRILDISQKVGALHIAPAFSCLEMLDLIYNQLIDHLDSSCSVGDVFLLSKGHGCIAQYTILEDLGVLSTNDLEQYCKTGGILGAHPDRGTPGIVASTGSLGHGLGLAVGISYAEKLKNSKDKIFVLVSDGELQEGSSWEAIMMAANLDCGNLVTFVDYNDFGGLHRMSEFHKAFAPLKEKFLAFGWECVEVNGHSSIEMYDGLQLRSGNKPFALICNTTKGKGVDFMENVPIWHYRSPNRVEYLNAIAQLKEITK